MRQIIPILLLAALAGPFAWAYDVDKYSTADYAVVWPSPTGTTAVPFQLKLPVTPIGIEGKNYTLVVQEAMATWNTKLGTLELTSTSINTPILSTPVGGDSPNYESGDENSPINEIVVDSSIDGEAFEANTLAVTVSYSYANIRAESDIIFNAAIVWSVYAGGLQPNVQDLRRVALHELGHALGLNHPDQASPAQTVAAIMNSHVSSTDNLTADDIAGAQYMYGAPGVIPGNNDFANAITLTLSAGSAQGTGNSIGASKEAGEPFHAGNVGGRSVWWKWTATGTGSSVASLLGSTFDTTMGVYTGASVSSLTFVGSNDDEEPLVGHPDSPSRKRNSKVTFNAVNGTTYYFAVDGWDGEQGPVVISLTFSGPVDVAPGITSHPASQTVTAGANVSFTGGASGTPAPTFQWRKNNVDIGGATGTTLTLNNVQAGDAGSYTLVATNSAGTATSNPATLTVNPAVTLPSFTVEPGNQTVAAGTAVTLTAAASGNPAPTFQWQKNGVNIPGATNASYTIPSITADDAGNYAVVASNSAGNVASNVVTVVVTSRMRGDFNGDGKADILWSNTVTGERSMWFMNGNAPGSGAAMASVPAAWKVSGTRDYNGDGKADILWTNTATGDRAMWLMNGTTILLNAFLTTVPLDWIASANADFNGDGKADILWSNTVSGDHAIWLMNGNLVDPSSGYLATIPVAWKVAGAGDFNGDGKADILWSNSVTGELSMWFMNGTAPSSGAALSAIPVAWKVSGTGDYNGDGKADILWTNISTGDRAMWLMNGTTIVLNAFLTTVPLDWVVSGNADYNGDGKSDILWSNTVTGDRAVWLMNGNLVDPSSGYLATIPAVWEISGGP